MPRIKFDMRFAPLVFTVGYLMLTLAITVFGPVIYVGYDWPRVAAYLGAICVSISIGYFLGVRRPMALPTRGSGISYTRFDRKIFQVVLAISFLGLIYTLFEFLTSGAVNLDIGSVGRAYNDTYKYYEKNSGTYSFSFILYSLIAAPSFIVTIWGIYYLKYLNLLERGATLLVVFGAPVIFMLSAGQQKTIGDLIVYLSAIFILRAVIGGKSLNLKTVLIIAAVGVAGLAMFNIILTQRYDAIGINAININEREIDLVQYDTNHPVFKIFGFDLGFTLSILCMYIGNGLVGLGYALKAPFTWSFMLGTAYPLSVIGDRVFGLPFAYEYTYPYVAAYSSGWGESRWYSVFAWFASDFTFLGTIPIFGFFAYVYSRCWVESIRFANPFAILLFCLLTLGVVMMPANNQLMQTPGGLATLCVTVALYLMFRRRYNRPSPFMGSARL